MLRTVQFADTFDSKKVRPYSADLRAHVVEQFAELLQIGFTSCVVDRGSTFGEHGCHDDIGSTGDRRFIKQHVRAFEMFSLKTISQQLLVVLKRSTEVHHALEMGIKTPTTDLIAAGLGVGYLT